MKRKLRPSQIRFTQNTINSHFHDGQHVNTVANEIENGGFDFEGFRDMEVYREDGEYYSRNNRLLYAYRVAEYRGGVGKITVEIVEKTKDDARKFSSRNNGTTVEVRNDATTLEHYDEDWL